MNPELLPATPANVQALQTATPMMLLSMAIEKGTDLDQLQKLMDLQERWEANEARKAFVAAMAAFKANPPRLEKNKLVNFSTSKGQTSYRHATLDHVADVLGAELSKHGLSFRWNVTQEQARIVVTCILQHCMGHSESVTMSGTADDSGSKNPIQQVGSTVTYLERYTLLAATGMATAEQDTDGRGSDPSGTQAMDGASLESLLVPIREAADARALSAAFNAAFPKAKSQTDKDQIMAAKNQRQSELRGGAR